MARQCGPPSCRRRVCLPDPSRHGWHALARRAAVTFEVEGLDELAGGIDSLRGDEFFPKEVLLPNRIVGLREVIRDAVALDYIRTGLSRKQIETLVQIVTPDPTSQ
jgi:hypothetical protein